MYIHYTTTCVIRVRSYTFFSIGPDALSKNTFRQYITYYNIIRNARLCKRRGVVYWFSVLVPLRFGILILLYALRVVHCLYNKQNVTALMIFTQRILTYTGIENMSYDNVARV